MTRTSLLGGLAAAAVVMLGQIQMATAVPVFIDGFGVMKNGALLFQDTFSDGNPPPSAPPFASGAPASYFVQGSLDEAGGKVRLDTAGALIVPGAGIATGQFVFLERARLNTDIDPTNFVLGLKSDDTFSVTGVFDLAVPGPISELYGVALSDAAAGKTPDDFVRIEVIRLLDGSVRIVFIDFDFVLGTATGIASTSLDPLHDQIALTLTRGDVATNAISASFTYIDGGVPGPTTTFAAAAQIFNGENWTRAEFEFVSPVPEPSALLLLGAGLAGFGLAVWSQRRRNVSGHRAGGLLPAWAIRCVLMRSTLSASPRLESDSIRLPAVPRALPLTSTSRA